MTVLAVAALWAAFPASAEGRAGTATDRAALEALYDATGGANWTNSAGWKTTVPLSEWFGVSTDESGRVTVLWLNGNALTGPIPDVLLRCVRRGGQRGEVEADYFVSNARETGETISVAETGPVL